MNSEYFHILGQKPFDVRETVESAVLTLHHEFCHTRLVAVSRSRLFKPFFTTRRDLGGRGLGMHIVYNLVTPTLGGTISCHSASGEGLSMLIDIPMVR